MKKGILVLMIGFLLIGVNLYAADGDLIVEGSVGIGNNLINPGARFQINTDVATTKGQIIKGAAGQSANLQEWHNSNGNILTHIRADGRLDAAITLNTSSWGSAAVNVIGSNIGTGGIRGGIFQGTWKSSASSNLDTMGLDNLVSFEGQAASGTYSYSNAASLVGSRQMVQFLSALGGTYNFSNPVVGLLANFKRSAAGTGDKGIYNITDANVIQSGGITGDVTGVGSLPMNITTLRHFSASNPPYESYSNIIITNLYGVSIAEQTRGTNNTNFLIGTGTTGNWSIYNNSPYDNYFAGNVGIGTTTPTHPLEMGSGAYVTTGGVWTNASSREYKENISDLLADKALQTLKELNPVQFNYKANKEEKHIGFIAEEVPDLVATKDRKGLSPMDIVAVLTRVVQEQQKTIEELKSKVIQLETKELR